VSRDRTNGAGDTSLMLCGSITNRTAYALVNRAILAGLRGAGRVVKQVDHLALAHDFPGTVIHYDYLQHFNTVTRPSHCRHFVTLRTWDFGPYPPAWRDRINGQCDQVWVLCDWARRKAGESGIRPELVRVIPLGFDPSIFTPEGPAYELPTRKRFKFLFVGGAVFRKGFDILLNAYRSAFTPADDVCLVIHAQKHEIFYKGVTMLDRISAPARSDGPQVLLHDTFVSEAELGALYRACDVGVYPYRAEGFALPILEGLAAGLPPIVPAFGASLDYCNPKVAFQIPARRIALPLRGAFFTNTLGLKEEVDGVDFCEVDPHALADAMRRAYEMPRADLRTISEAAAAHALAHHTWGHMMDTVLAALRALGV
jgi:glycosyltransferase involved in cell wall biosynthesis